MTLAIEVDSLVKKFGDVRALDGVSLSVEQGSVFGLLGPNGAGKTTCVRVLCTLLQPDGGRAVVNGYDVVREQDKVRAVVGLAGQYATVDELLTGRENLMLIARLLGDGKKTAKLRADELLERFDLADAATRRVKTYSGGMRRRLDLAVSIIGRPSVVVLDEPTTGLDPRSRQGVWDMARELVSDGTTLLLTTQYLEEADRLADRLVVVDRGRIVEQGTPAELKSRAGRAVLEVELPERTRPARLAAALAALVEGAPRVDGRLVSLDLRPGTTLVDVVRAVDAARVPIVDLSVHQPTLDDVFLKLTGRVVTTDTDDEEGAAA
jgi:daunorubicin resistance ABC transporter ATP-binding subunit